MGHRLRVSAALLRLSVLWVPVFAPACMRAAHHMALRTMWLCLLLPARLSACPPPLPPSSSWMWKVLVFFKRIKAALWLQA